MLHLVSLSASLPSYTHDLHYLIFLLFILYVPSPFSAQILLCGIQLLHSPPSSYINYLSTSNNHTNLQQQQQQLLLFFVLCIYIFCAPCACNVLHSSSCFNRANLLHLSSALCDLHRNSSTSLVVFPSVF
jgi:hypothetical protein